MLLSEVDIIAVAHSSSSPSASLKFTNLLSRLLEQVCSVFISTFRADSRMAQPVLTRKYAAIVFLHALASSPPSSQPNTSSFLPALAPPPPPALTPPIQSPSSSQSSRPPGKSKAELLKDHRTRAGASRSVTVEFRAPSCLPRSHYSTRKYSSPRHSLSATGDIRKVCPVFFTA